MNIFLTNRKLRSSAEAKIYVLTRYAGLAGQMFNIWFAFRMASGVPNSTLACQAWYTYQTATIQCLLFAVETLLMVRVYKMYKKGKAIRALLIMFSSAQAVAMAVNAQTIVTGTHYTPTCITITPHRNRIYVGVSIIATFMFISFTMLWRYFRDTTSWSEAPRAWRNLAVRDGSITTVVITAIFIFMFLCTMGIIDIQMSRNFFFYVLLSCLWFAAGRIVLHQEKFRENYESQKGSAHDSSRLTTIEVDLDDFAPSDAIDGCPESASDFRVDSTEVPNLSGSELDVGTKDITDERICELDDDDDDDDDVSLSSCTPTFILMETRISAEDSGSGT
ncbi:hypothetical protein DEU56DRAFT_940252 [Suillus clintonianus]|uniref:uncharacterized protein n=1 Tax=Suillus clintonianus TaxID=1904413 RepID=UPI001B8727E9|nr:uncharacterized protein DEU56DRAFT_940252 [Suillus clintonianus]KAG2141860.1 hypothetical protein DEU56DRAFT_940252 [Suillus clintonianus]